MCNVSAQTGLTVLNQGQTGAPDAACTSCGSEGRNVERKTVLHHVRHDLLGQVRGEAYRFCHNPECQIVYYGDDGMRFAISDLRMPVTVKVCGDERPICYCFGFTEGDARKEIASTGSSNIPVQISQLIKAGMCACEVRNPSGSCCLGEVIQTVKRLSVECSASAEPSLGPAHDCCAR